MRCAVVPFSHGNLGSLLWSLKRLGHEVSVWETAADVGIAQWVIFPGVGAMQDVKDQLSARGLSQILQRLHQASQPFLGICLGLQLGFSDSEEGGRGLGWIEGRVRHLHHPVTPHIGWNDLSLTASAPAWLAPYADQCFYFVHSYYVDCADQNSVVAQTHWGQTFPSMIVSGSFVGTQFHPELSGDVGESLLKDILEKMR